MVKVKGQPRNPVLPPRPHPPATVAPGPSPELPPWLEITVSNVRTASNTATSLSERTITTARVGDYIREVYGRERVGPNIVRATVHNGALLIVAVWCLGEVEAVEQVILNGEGFTGSATHYTGTAGQTADATVAAAFGQADDLPGICYSVLPIPAGEDLQIEAIIQGRKVYDPRTTLTAYSENPALHLADFIDRYTDQVPHWDSVVTAADRCDELVNGQERWAIGLSLEDPRPVTEWIQTLREYAAVFLAHDAGEIRFIPDAPAAVAHTLTVSDIRRGSLQLKKRGLRDVPTQVRVTWTYAGDVEWREPTFETAPPDPGVPLRVTELSMPGFKRHARAARKGREVLNKANLTDLECGFETFDTGLAITVGDVFELTHPIGLEDKQFRAVEVQAIEKGRWHVKGWEYDPAVYSNSTESDPTFPDSNLPNPGDIPNGPEPTLAEKLFVDEGGKTFSRWEITFTGVDWPFVNGYRVRVTAGGETVMDSVVGHQGTVQHKAATPPVKQHIEYTVDIWIINSFGKQSTMPGSTAETALGKLIKPVAPSNLTGFEAGEFVSLKWDPGLDIDLIGYRIKRLEKADYDADPKEAWNHANAIIVADRHDALRILLEAQPVGEQIYMAKSLDSLGQESEGENAPWGRTDAPIDVTADSAGGTLEAFLGGNVLGINYINMHRFEAYGDSVYHVTSSHRDWVDIFGAAGSSWADNVAAGEAWGDSEAVASSIPSDLWDIGADKNGDWQWTVQITVVQGTLTNEIAHGTTADGVANNTDPGKSFSGLARYIRAFPQLSGNPGDGMIIKEPFHLIAQPRLVTETQEVSVPAAPQPLAVSWTSGFLVTPEITTTTLGSNPRTIAVDNLDEDGCEVYAWNPSGTPAAATVKITAMGA